MSGVKWTWTRVPCGTTLTAKAGAARLHTTGDTKSLWVIGTPTRSQWRRAVRAAGMDKRQGRRFVRRHAPHHQERAA